jgi:iron complex transport system permease protein
LVLACVASVGLSSLLGAHAQWLSLWNDGGREVWWNIRVPRVLQGVLVGSALGLSGAWMQALFRNPLADPGLIGVSSGAALGAGLVIVAGLAGMWQLPMAAFAGALLVTALAWRLARTPQGVHMSTLLLAGIAINALSGAGLGLLSHVASDQQLRSLSFWMLGSLSGAHWSSLAVMAGLWCVACGMPLFRRSLPSALDVLGLGEAGARMSGVNVQRLQWVGVLGTALAVGAVTAFSGMVGFIGLVAPHLARLCLGASHRVVLPGSAVLGATLVVLSDAVARTVAAPAELPLGVLTALLGTPLFVALLRSQTRMSR